MANPNTNIPGIDGTWNPVVGCTQVSLGCQNCYAKAMALKLQQWGNSRYANGFCLTLFPLNGLPKELKRSKRIFVNSMSDLFHDQIPLNYIKDVFAVMHDYPDIIFMVLTKRSQRLVQLSNELIWTPNIQMGVTVEESRYTFRIDDLRSAGAVVKFLSCEPLLGPLHNLNLQGIDQMFVGGESGPNRRSMDINWARDLRDQAIKAGVRFFFKQAGAFRPASSPELLDGVIWGQLP